MISAPPGAAPICAQPPHAAPGLPIGQPATHGPIAGLEALPPKRQDPGAPASTGHSAVCGAAPPRHAARSHPRVRRHTAGSTHGALASHTTRSARRSPARLPTDCDADSHSHRVTPIGSLPSSHSLFQGAASG
eukprot:1400927-Prymnesium_polylepis.1